MLDRYAPSMRQRIDVGRRFGVPHVNDRCSTYDGSAAATGSLNSRSTAPFSLDDFIAERIDSFSLAGAPAVRGARTR